MYLFRRRRPIPEATLERIPLTVRMYPRNQIGVLHHSVLPDEGYLESDIDISTKPYIKLSRNGRHYYDAEERGLYSDASSLETEPSIYERQVEVRRPPMPLNPIVNLMHTLHVVRQHNALFQEDARGLQPAPAPPRDFDRFISGPPTRFQSVTAPNTAIILHDYESSDEDDYAGDLERETELENGLAVVAQSALILTQTAPAPPQNVSSIAQVAPQLSLNARVLDADDAALDLSFASERLVLKPRPRPPPFLPETVGSNNIQFEWLLRELSYGHYVRDETPKLRFLKNDMKTDYSLLPRSVFSFTLINRPPTFPQKKRTWYSWLRKARKPYEGPLFNPNTKLSANRGLREEVGVSVSYPVVPSRIITKETEFLRYEKKYEMSKNGMEIRPYTSHKGWNNLKFLLRHADIASPKAMVQRVEPSDLGLAFQQCHRAYLQEEWEKLRWSAGAFSKT